MRNSAKRYWVLLLSYTFISLPTHIISENKTDYPSLSEQTDELCPQCQIYFTDGIEIHEKAYKKEGIIPQIDFKGLDSLRKKKILKKVYSNQKYSISNLEHSVPLLLPKAVSFLNKLSDRYQKKCKAMNVDYLPFRITSLTRSINSVKSLASVNGNAIENSAHLKGKTFDISYMDFGYHDQQKQAFVEALKELHKERKCYAKYEYNQKCLHITVR